MLALGKRFLAIKIYQRLGIKANGIFSAGKCRVSSPEGYCNFHLLFNFAVGLNHKNEAQDKLKCIIQTKVKGAIYKGSIIKWFNSIIVTIMQS